MSTKSGIKDSSATATPPPTRKMPKWGGPRSDAYQAIKLGNESCRQDLNKSRRAGPSVTDIDWEMEDWESGGNLGGKAPWRGFPCSAWV